MSTVAAYKNHQHYIREGWSPQPKESFKWLAEIITRQQGAPTGAMLDVGCATGELLSYMNSRFSALQYTGVDIFPELIAEGARLLPQATFVQGSALELPATLHGKFDIVTAMGCMSIFDDTQLPAFWDNLLQCTRPGALIVVLAPLNEYGCDTLVRHRKRTDGRLGSWETGWNVFSFETVQEVLATRGVQASLERFAPNLTLNRRSDPVRTWTLPTSEHPRQLTNGLKLLVDHYFICVKR